VGYYFIFFSSQHRLENVWLTKIYQENQEFKNQRILEIPISLPYFADQEDFQETNTSFEQDGHFYRAIKQRYQKDTLQIIYVPDVAKNQLNKSITSWVKSIVQKEMPNDGGNPITWKWIDKIMINDLLDFSLASALLVKKPFESYTQKTLQTFLPIHCPPPLSGNLI
jgi:hypothetical protein